MSARERTKGITFERDVANFLAQIWPEARRGLQFRGGAESADVEGTPFHVECKNCDRWSVLAWWRETVCDAESKGRPPLLVIKRRRNSVDESLVVMRLADFVAMHRVRHRLPTHQGEENTP